MSLISAASIRRIVFAIARAVPLSVLVAAIAIIGSEFAHAVDGNYVSPYASQYATHSAAAAIPNETWFGLLLVIVTVLSAAFYSLRHRLRLRQPA